MKDTELIKEAIKHIDEVLNSNCNEACKQDHHNLKRWLEEFLECRERICKNCKRIKLRGSLYPEIIDCPILPWMTVTYYGELVENNFGCDKFERRIK